MIVDSTLFLCLCWVLIRADWNQIALESIKRQLKEDKKSKIKSKIKKEKATDEKPKRKRKTRKKK